MSNIETHINNLIFLKNSLIVDCRIGNIIIEESQDKMYYVENNGFNRKYKTKKEVFDLCGEIFKISMLDHDTEEEEIIYKK